MPIFGQIASNTDLSASTTTSGTVKIDVTDADPIVYTKGSADTLLAAKVTAAPTGLKITTSDSAPSSPATGDIWITNSVDDGLALGSASTHPATDFLLVTNNLSELTSSASTARTNIAAAPLASPTFTGTPSAPTAALGTNTTQVATTAFVLANAVNSSSNSILALCQGRLTTETGVPISSADRTAQSTLYFTPYNGNTIALFTNSAWTLYTFTERSIALSGLTSGKNYDVFIYDNSGTVTLELSAAWTNDTTRADALTTQDGIYVKSGATTRRLLGSIRTTGTTTTEDSAANRFVANLNNTVLRRLYRSDDTSHTVQNVGREWRAGTQARASFVLPMAQDIFTSVSARIAPSTTSANVFINNSVDNISESFFSVSGSTAIVGSSASSYYNVTAGYHYMTIIETEFANVSVTVDLGRTRGHIFI